MPLRYCRKCREYTLEEECPKCGGGTVKPYPPRFSPDDRYGRYRRMLKKESMKGEGYV